MRSVDGLAAPSGRCPAAAGLNPARAHRTIPTPQVRCKSRIPILDKVGTRCEHNCKAWAYTQRQNREVTVKHVLGALLGAVTLLASAPSNAQTTLTIATVHNGDMIRMQASTNESTAKIPDMTRNSVTH